MLRFACLTLGLTLAMGGIAAAQAPAAAPPVSAPPAATATATAGQTFLATNAKAPGVVVLPSGLQYKVVASGPESGPSPRPGDIIKVHYEGKLLDGTVFDSSFERKQSAIMPLDGLVQAWLEALPMMKVGDEWVLYVPPALGYGDRDVGPIPAGSVMTFRLQLLGMLAVD
ncbi:FKBP-type peptidyl-prolyl cis-trans isomerase [Caulobacter sp. DWR1-3-2b1]|uniref:FKBP-type peptidyl-prolyl cis-trans isomerase n=1 Tax=Caulobacter sp. DWR1-3-2b1 TaxID=2804670 RepID=UPI003CEAB4E3